MLVAALVVEQLVGDDLRGRVRRKGITSGTV
jgi:hypothetical protein